MRILSCGNPCSSPINVHGECSWVLLGSVTVKPEGGTQLVATLHGAFGQASPGHLIVLPDPVEMESQATSRLEKGETALVISHRSTPSSAVDLDFYVVGVGVSKVRLAKVAAHSWGEATKIASAYMSTLYTGVPQTGSQ